MERRAHVVFGSGVAAAAAWLLGLCPVDARAVWLLSWALLGSTLPDADLRRRHRVLLHNLTAVALASAAVGLGLAMLGAREAALLAATGLAVGMGSHLLLDSFTVRGVALLFPLSGRRFRLLRLRSSSPAANALFSTIGAALLLAYIVHCGWAPPG